MPIRMYDEAVGIDRQVYGFVTVNGRVCAVCYDEHGNGYTINAALLRPIE